MEENNYQLLDQYKGINLYRKLGVSSKASLADIKKAIKTIEGTVTLSKKADYEFLDAAKVIFSSDENRRAYDAIYTMWNDKVSIFTEYEMEELINKYKETDLYAMINVNSDADAATITANIDSQFAKATTVEERKRLKEVKAILTNEKNRKAYDSARNSYVTSTRNKRWLAAGVAAAIAVAGWGGYEIGKDRKSNPSSATATPAITEELNVVATPVRSFEPTATPAPTQYFSGSQIPIGGTGVQSNKSFVFDARNEIIYIDNNSNMYAEVDEVNEKVDVIFNYFTSAKVVNPITGTAYTKEEIKDIILFVNGKYVATSEQDAEEMLTKFSSFVAAIMSCPSNMNTVNYMAGISSVKLDDLVRSREGVTVPNFAQVMILDKNNCYPLLNWFSIKYQILMTSDKEVDFISTFNEMSQVFVDLVYGNGVQIDGVDYTLAKFANDGNVAEGNVLQMMGWLYQAGYNKKVNKDIKFYNSQLGESSVNVDTLYKFFNMICDEGTYNYCQVNQMNTVDKAKDNYYRKNGSQRTR